MLLAKNRITSHYTTSYLQKLGSSRYSYLAGVRSPQTISMNNPISANGTHYPHHEVWRIVCIRSDCLHRHCSVVCDKIKNREQLGNYTSAKFVENEFTAQVSKDENHSGAKKSQYYKRYSHPEAVKPSDMTPKETSTEFSNRPDVASKINEASPISNTDKYDQDK
jgi:hypothetical protein